MSLNANIASLAGVGLSVAVPVCCCLSANEREPAKLNAEPASAPLDIVDVALPKLNALPVCC